MKYQRHHAGSRAIACGVALATLTAAAAFAAMTAPAATAAPRTAIVDPVATPTWTATLAGVPDGTDVARSVIVLRGGATLVGGELSVTPTATVMCLSRYRGGFREWTRSWAASASAGTEGTALVLSPDGRWVYQVGNAGSKLVVLKWSTKNGTLAWSRRYAVPGHQSSRCIAAGVDARGNVVALSKTSTATDVDWAVVSCTPSGARRWTTVLLTKDVSAYPWDFAVALDGSSYATGLWCTPKGIEQSAVIRLSAAGKVLWSKKYAGPENLGAQTYALALRPGGGVYVAGYTKRAATAQDGMVLAYKTNGARAATDLDPYKGAADTDEAFLDVTVTAAGNIVAAGDSSPPWPADRLPYVAMFGSDGVKRWGYAAAATDSESFSLAGSDPFGGWYVAGAHHTSAFVTGVRVLRGSEVENAGSWVGEWLPVADAWMEPIGMAVRDTSVCVVGALRAGGGDYDQFAVDFTY